MRGQRGMTRAEESSCSCFLLPLLLLLLHSAGPSWPWQLNPPSLLDRLTVQDIFPSCSLLTSGVVIGGYKDTCEL